MSTPKDVHTRLADLFKCIRTSDTWVEKCAAVEALGAFLERDEAEPVRPDAYEYLLTMLRHPGATLHFMVALECGMVLQLLDELSHEGLDSDE